MQIRQLALFLLFPAILGADALLDEQVAASETAHNLESWWGKDLVQADVVVDFGGQEIVNGTFTFEAHGPKARYDRADGVSVIFDGDSAWVTPAEAEAPMGRFHVLTWPWFIMAPFKMTGEGVNLSDLEVTMVDEKPRVSIFQTFGENLGDTPEDWYRFFIDPASDRIEEMSYIVTFGKSAEDANAQPSIIRYFDYQDSEGPLISTRYEFWFWDPNSKKWTGPKPKGTGTVSNINYPERSEDSFLVPDDAQELILPSGS